MFIINNKTLEKICLYSKKGKQLLKKYILTYLNNKSQYGGSDENTTNTFEKTEISEFEDYNLTFQEKKRKNEPKFYLLSMSSQNAVVDLVIKNEEWREDYSLSESFKSNLRISRIYSRVDKTKKRAPKFFVRKMLCYLLKKIMNKENVFNLKLNPKSIIVLEADGSKNDDLVNKVYKKMGFVLIAKNIYEEDDYPGTGGLLQSNIETVLKTNCL